MEDDSSCTYLDEVLIYFNPPYFWQSPASLLAVYFPSNFYCMAICTPWKWLVWTCHASFVKLRPFKGVMCFPRWAWGVVISWHASSNWLQLIEVTKVLLNISVNRFTRKEQMFHDLSSSHSLFDCLKVQYQVACMPLLQIILGSPQSKRENCCL